MASFIRGYLLETGTKPNHRLSLYFDKKHRSAIPLGTKEIIELDLGQGITWQGTMNSMNASNPPYVHDWLTSSRSGRQRCTDVFHNHGLGIHAELTFELVGRNYFRLVQIVNRGMQNLGLTSASPTAIAATAKMRPAIPATSSFPFDDLTAILNLALEYWNLISSSEAIAEQAFEREMPIARKQGFLTKELFVRLGRWKSVRQTPNYESNDEMDIRAATARAFSANDERTAILALTRLRGVALRTASALLQWMRPELFPILDIRVVGALGRPEPSSYEDMDFYLDITRDVRALAQRHGLDLRTMDRALWAWHKKQGKGACCVAIEC